MRTALGVLLILHGIAHLPGFLVPWRVVASTDLPYKTTLLSGMIDVGDGGIRAVGMLWLAAGVGLVASGGAVLMWAPWALDAMLVAAIASLVMSLADWPAARIGAFVNLGLLALLWGGRLTEVLS